MDRLTINGVRLCLEKFPTRKGECFYMEDVSTNKAVVVGWVKPKDLAEVNRLWQKILDGFPYAEVEV